MYPGVLDRLARETTGYEPFESDSRLRALRERQKVTSPERERAPLTWYLPPLFRSKGSFLRLYRERAVHVVVCYVNLLYNPLLVQDLQCVVLIK